MTFDELYGIVHAKMLRGRTEYGDASWYRPKHELVGELQAEATDLIGWGLILYSSCVGVNSDDPMSGLFSYLWTVFHASDHPPTEMTPHSYSIWVGAMGVKLMMQSARLRKGDLDA